MNKPAAPAPSRRVSQELLQKIKAATNIVEVVGEHVVLRKSGANYTGLCPFHSERSPSFSVSENKQLYHCYGCKKGGDLVSFVMEIHGLDFMEAVTELAERARIALPKEVQGGVDASLDPETQRRREEARKKLETAYKLNRFAAAFFHQALSQNPVAAKYLKNRGIGDELVRSFYLGAAPAGWEALAAHLVAKQAPLPLAVELGLIRPSTKGAAPGGSGYFDLFRNRAIFPILDLRGRVAGFGGRALPGGDEKPKYLNSPDSLLFQKSKLAFGLFQAQKHIREKDEVILVEGYFDVLALHAAGFQNVVASCGTALTPEHLALFKKFASRVTILFDGDDAGVAATERAMEVGLDLGQILYGAVMPADLDPDEVLFDQETGLPKPGGKERMEAILAAAHPLLDARIAAAVQQAQAGPEARTVALKTIAGWLLRFKDPVGREVRVQDVQKKLGVGRDLLNRAMGAPSGGHSGPAAAGRSQVSPRPVSQAKPRVAQGRLSRGEKVLLGGLVRGGAYARILQESQAKLPPETGLDAFFSYPPAKDFVSRLARDPQTLELFRSEPQGFMEGDLDPQVRSTLTEALIGGEESFTEEDFRGALDQGLTRIWARFSQRIKTALAEAEAKKDAGLQAKLMQEYLDVQRKMKEFIRLYDEA